MALTRKSLKAMGIDEDKVDQIIELHTETVDALKAQRDRYKDDADKLAGVQRELDDLKAAGNDGFEAKYNDIKKQFDDYKAEITAKEVNAAKGKAYRALIEGAGIKGEKLIETILKSTDLSKVELDGDKVKDADNVTATIKEEWKDYIGSARFDWSAPINGGGKPNTNTENETMNAFIRGQL